MDTIIGISSKSYSPIANSLARLKRNRFMFLFRYALQSGTPRLHVRKALGYFFSIQVEWIRGRFIIFRSLSRNRWREIRPLGED